MLPRLRGLQSRWAAGFSILMLSAMAYASWPGIDAFLLPSAAPQVQVAATAEREESRLTSDGIAAYLTQDWKLGQDYAVRVAAAVLSAAYTHGVDPVLILSVAAVESSFQHWVGNPDGGKDPMKPYGIMQVAGQYHVDKFPGRQVRRTSLDENVDIGTKVLREYLDKADGDERLALRKYSGSRKSDSYFRKVNRVRQQVLDSVGATSRSGSAL